MFTFFYNINLYLLFLVYGQVLHKRLKIATIQFFLLEAIDTNSLEIIKFTK